MCFWTGSTEFPNKIELVGVFNAYIKYRTLITHCSFNRNYLIRIEIANENERPTHQPPDRSAREQIQPGSATKHDRRL